MNPSLQTDRRRRRAGAVAAICSSGAAVAGVEAGHRHETSADHGFTGHDVIVAMAVIVAVLALAVAVRLLVRRC